MTQPPLVSVLLPVYNTDPAHLHAAIESILGQTHTDFELLIYNDASTHENVEETVLSYKDSRIIYTRSAHNAGIAKVRNTLIDMAKGRYLAVMDHDDLCLPTRLARQVAFMEARPDVGICGTAYKRFGKTLKNNTIRHPNDSDSIRATLFFKNAIHHPSAMIRADILHNHSIRYDERFISVNDRKLFLDISSISSAHNLSDALCLYRLHDGMTSQKKRLAINAEQEILRNDMINSIGAILNPEQIHILNNFIVSGRQHIKEVSVLNTIETTLSALNSANQRSRFFPPAAFEQICASYLIKRCANAALFGGISSHSLLKRTQLPVNTASLPLLLRVFNALKR